MTEKSFFWNTNGIGDGGAGGFDRVTIASWVRKVFGRGEDGILDTVGNMLAVSGASSPLSVATGAALIDGIFYENDAAKNLTVTTPTTGTTGGRVVLRADWTAQTVRAAVLLNTDGVSDPPELTETRGSLFEFSLATFQISTGGVISSLQNVENPITLPGLSVIGNSTPERIFGEALIAATDGQVLRRSGSELGFGRLATGGITDGEVSTAKLVNDAVDDTKAGNRVPQFYRRQGGSESVWDAPGSTNYTPGQVIVQGGVERINSYLSPTGEITITMPVAIANPLILLAITRVYGKVGGVDGDRSTWWVVGICATTEGMDPGTFKITARKYGTLYYQTSHIDVAWLAIGPPAA